MMGIPFVSGIRYGEDTILTADRKDTNFCPRDVPLVDFYSYR